MGNVASGMPFALECRVHRWLWAGGLSASAAALALSFYLGAVSSTVWPEQTVVADEMDLSSDFDSMLFGIGFDGEVT